MRPIGLWAWLLWIGPVLHTSVLSNPRYSHAAKRAGGCCWWAKARRFESKSDSNVRPLQGFARIMQHFHPYKAPEPGVDEQAWVATDAQVAGARIDHL